MDRPQPPKGIFDSLNPEFVPAPEVGDWVEDIILTDDGELTNPDHFHLRQASIGYLWTNTINTRKGMRIVGMAEKPRFMCNKWQKARQELQIQEWFKDQPDFIITLDAYYSHECDDVDFCMLIEHELYHCAQAYTTGGMPKFNQQTGRPTFEIRGHDVEEFVGVVERYGVGDKDSNLARLVSAAGKKPEVGKAKIKRACGTCHLRAVS